MRFPRGGRALVVLLLLWAGSLSLLPGFMAAAADSPIEPGTGHRFDPAVATRTYLESVPEKERAKTDAYFEGGYWLQLWDFLAGLAVAGLILGTGISARIRDWAEGWIRWSWARTALYSAIYILLTALLTFPLALYEGFFREHQYGLSNQTFGAWLGDQGKGLAVGIILGSLGLTLLYAVLRRAGRGWWLWGSIVTLLFVIFTALIAPVFIAPLFNEYRPLQRAELREQILSLARANGIPARDVYEFDASRQTKRISANVSGFAGTMRISLNDNLLQRCTPAEIRHVMGHEMGHYVLNHVFQGILFSGVCILGGFAFLRWGFERASRWRGARWGVRELTDVAGVPLLGALLSIYFFVLTPITNSYTRSQEAEADLFALNAAREPDAAAQVALKLGEYRKLAPGPVEEWVFFDHPSGRNRIFQAMRWKAEQPSPDAAVTPSP